MGVTRADVLRVGDIAALIRASPCPEWVNPLRRKESRPSST
jgi:hypothetical protein